MRQDYTTNESGFVTLYVLAVATITFLLLGMSIQANRALLESNNRQQRRLDLKASELAIVKTPDALPQ